MIRKYFRKIFSQAGQECIATIFSLIKKRSDTVLLDCDCGDGEFTQQIIEKLGGCKEVHGIEIVEE